MTLFGSRSAKATISSRNSFMALLAIALFKKIKEKVKGGRNKFLKKYTRTANDDVRQQKKVKSKSGDKTRYGDIQKSKAIVKVENDSKQDDRKELDNFIETQITRLGGRDEVKGMSNADIVNSIADDVINQIPNRPNILNDLFPSIFSRLGEESQIDPRTQAEQREAKVEDIVSSGDESPPMPDPLKNVRGVLPERTKAEIAQEKKEKRQIKKDATKRKQEAKAGAKRELDRLYGSDSESEDERNLFEEIRNNLNNLIGLSNDQKDELRSAHNNLEINLETLLNANIPERKAEAVALNRNYQESRQNILALIGGLPDLPETKNVDINRLLENLPANLAVFKPLIRNLLKGQIGTASEIAGGLVGLIVSSLITKNPAILGITMYITRYISGQFNTQIENTITNIVDGILPGLPEPPTPAIEEKQPEVIEEKHTRKKISIKQMTPPDGDPDPDPDPEGGGGGGDPEEKKKKDDFGRVIPLVAIATTLLLRDPNTRERLFGEVAKNVGGAMLTGRILGRRISYGILKKIGYTTDELGTIEGRRLINLLASVPSGVGGYIIANYLAPSPESGNKNAKALYERGREVVSNLMKDIGMTLSDVNLNITTPYKLGESPFDKPKKDKQLRGREFEKIPSMGLPSMGIPSMEADIRQRSTPIYQLYDTASKRNIPSLTGRPEEQLRQEINQNITILKQNKTEKGLNTFRNILTPIFNKYSNVVAPSILKEEAKRINAETERIFTEEPTTTTTTPAPTEQGFISSLVNSAIDTVSNMIGTGGGDEDDYIYERKIEQSKTDKTKQEVIDNTLAKSDQVEQKDRKGKANMKWQPKVIVPSTDIFSESNHEKYIDAVEFAQFNYVPKGSEGGYGTPATNPLKMADKLSEEIRYKGAGVYIPINYYNELLEASRLNEKKLKELFLPPELPPMKFINQNNDTTFDNVNTRFYVNNENTAVGITDPYSKFSNVDNYWMTNPNNVLFTINP